jgi:endonuclease YncB( thermonuclease family)
MKTLSLALVVLITGCTATRPPEPQEVTLGAARAPVQAEGTYSYLFALERVYDGDTVIGMLCTKITAHLPNQDADGMICVPQKVRVYGVDTPERGGRAKCDAERELAEKAKQYTADHVTGAEQIVIQTQAGNELGKFGRVLGDVLVDDKSLRGGLIAEELAVPYFGGTRDPMRWCTGGE